MGDDMSGDVFGHERLNAVFPSLIESNAENTLQDVDARRGRADLENRFGVSIKIGWDNS